MPAIGPPAAQVTSVPVSPPHPYRIKLPTLGSYLLYTNGYWYSESFKEYMLHEPLDTAVGRTYEKHSENIWVNSGLHPVWKMGNSINGSQYFFYKEDFEKKFRKDDTFKLES
jgi:hypothetical protein